MYVNLWRWGSVRTSLCSTILPSTPLLSICAPSPPCASSLFLSELTRPNDAVWMPCCEANMEKQQHHTWKFSIFHQPINHAKLVSDHRSTSSKGLTPGCILLQRGYSGSQLRAQYIISVRTTQGFDRVHSSRDPI